MKKIIVMINLFFLIFNLVFASWCFHDRIKKMNQPAIIKTAVRMRDIACMPWSQVVRVLKAWEKVGVIAESERYKVVDSQWNVWRVWRDFVKLIDDWKWVPNYTPDFYQNSFCSTLDLTKCPRPSAPWEIPEFYYQPLKLQNSDQNNNLKNNSGIVVSCNLSDSLKTKLSSLLLQFKENLLQKFDTQEEIENYILKTKSIIKKILSKKTWLIKCVLEYIYQNL